MPFSKGMLKRFKGEKSRLDKPNNGPIGQEINRIIDSMKKKNPKVKHDPKEVKKSSDKINKKFKGRGKAL